MLDAGLRISKPALNAKISILEILPFNQPKRVKHLRTFRYQTDFTKPSGIFENKWHFDRKQFSFQSQCSSRAYFKKTMWKWLAVLNRTNIPLHPSCLTAFVCNSPSFWFSPLAEIKPCSTIKILILLLIYAEIPTGKSPTVNASKTWYKNLYSFLIPGQSSL
jgi:hypothetical protein